MTKKTAKEPLADAAQAPASFPVSLGEFTESLPKGQVETVAAFRKLVQAEKITGKKPVEQWQQLYRKFQTKPVGVVWADWVNQKGRN